MQTLRHIPCVLAGVGLICLAACGTRSEARSTDPPLAKVERKVVIPDRTKQMKKFPCNECHDNAKARDIQKELPSPHSTIVMKHMADARQCYTCHDKQNRDQLRMLTGVTISFNDTPKLCGQCHPARVKDWNLGIHGKQVGSWRGTSHKYSCADCHDPHSPKRLKDKGYAPPTFPKLGVRKVAH